MKDCYNIKIKTKKGTYEYETEDLSDIDLIIMKHPDYEEFQATQREHRERKENTEKEDKCKKKVLKKQLK